MWRYAREIKQPLPYVELPFHHYPAKHGKYYGVEIKTNSIGLRDSDFNVPKPSGLKRVIFLGDSFTLGWGVPVNDTCAKLLEKKLNDVRNSFEVVNMGVGNYNSSMEVELLKRKGLALTPDMIVLMYYINDTEPTPVISRFKYLLHKHSYLVAYLTAMLSHINVNVKNSDILLDYYKDIYSADSKDVKQNSAAIHELVRICEAENIKLLIVNIPDLRRVRGYPFTFATDYIRSLAVGSRIPFLDLLPVFEKHEAKTLWVSPEDPHMNTKANFLAAEAVYGKILQIWNFED
jgi:lysophospholipase L1-like esterase